MKTKHSQTLTGKICKVAGPLVVAEDMSGAKMYDVVRVGPERLIGEVIELKDALASIQVYEETSGLKVGDTVESAGHLLSLKLGPGMLGGIYDGIQRPLKEIEKMSGAFIARGMEVSPLPSGPRWDFSATRSVGDAVVGGDTLGIVKEGLFDHHIMVAPGMAGTIVSLKSGAYTVNDTVATIKDAEGAEHEVKLAQEWPIRIPRPVRKKLVPTIPLVTGQRVIDTFFPIAKGGTGALPGPFGSGKSVAQQQLAKWSDADIIVYIGCGERGNEMTDVLLEFPELKDPRTGEDLMKRTILIANTSNMPVAAREASVYTGMTIAEYYRDMGYSVALMADSTSRWAEALREISGRLEEMPGDEGYPAYLGSRTAQFYERAGIAQLLGSGERIGSITAIGAVSPPGGDLSEPVTQNTLSVVKVFWGLEERLAYRRHYPAINWLTSYSLYSDQLAEYYQEKAGRSWSVFRIRALTILQDEAALEEVVRLVGLEALSRQEQILLHVARMIREDYLQQNAYDAVDTYTSLAKQYRLLKVIVSLYEQAVEQAGKSNFEVKDFLKLPAIAAIARAKFIPEENVAAAFDELDQQVLTGVASLVGDTEVASKQPVTA